MNRLLFDDNLQGLLFPDASVDASLVGVIGWRFFFAHEMMMCGGGDGFRGAFARRQLLGI